MTRLYVFEKHPSREEEDIRRQVESEFPEDPSLQLVYVARKRISKLTEHTGLT